MTNSSYLARREIYQNKNASEELKAKDERLSENHGTEDVMDRSGMNENTQPGDESGVVDTEKNNK